MSSSQDNNIFKKTSFLAGNNSAFIEEYYSEYLKDPSKLPQGWKEFFDGLKENKEVISKTLEGPSWAPKKKIKRDNLSSEDLLKEDSSKDNRLKDFPLTEESAKNSIRAIMLIRAFRIRGHLIANLDPLRLMTREEHLELKPETYGFVHSDFNKKNIFRWCVGPTRSNAFKNNNNFKKNLLRKHRLRVYAYGGSK